MDGLVIRMISGRIDRNVDADPLKTHLEDNNIKISAAVYGFKRAVRPAALGAQFLVIRLSKCSFQRVSDLETCHAIPEIRYLKIVS